MNNKFTYGFTLIELMVAISISVLIMIVVIFSYSKFNNDLALSSAGQEVSIAVRQTQIYGLSVKERSVGGGDFTSGYGIYFSTNSPQNFYIFSDNGAGTVGGFDGGANCATGGDCIIERVTLRNGITVSSICGTAFGGSSTCPPSGNSSLTSMNVIFPRPKTSADIRFTDNSYGSMTALYQAGKVVLLSPQGKTASITVEYLGQISLQ